MAEVPGDSMAEIRDKARAFAIDWYLSALRAPLPHRADLLTLAAFRGEISRIPLEVTDAALAEIKFQWWRDALSQGMFGARSGNPIADAVVDLLSRHKVSHEVALGVIDGFAREVYEDGIEDDEALAAYAKETERALATLAGAVLGAGPARDADDRVLAASARALALTHLALTLPIHISRGRAPIPASWLREYGDPRGAEGTSGSARAKLITRRLVAEARTALADARQYQGSVSSNNFAAILGVVLVEPYLRALSLPGHDALRDLADISPLTRVTRLLIGSWIKRV